MFFCVFVLSQHNTHSAITVCTSDCISKMVSVLEPGQEAEMFLGTLREV